jgi:hypothetical protein
MIYFSLFTRYILKIIGLVLKATIFYCYVTSNQEYGWRLWRAALFRKREKGDERQQLALRTTLHRPACSAQCLRTT